MLQYGSIPNFFKISALFSRCRQCIFKDPQYSMSRYPALAVVHRSLVAACLDLLCVNKLIN